jgi:transglutaminase-like putative cysteine protease
MLSADVMGFILIYFALQAFTLGISSSLRGTETRYLFWICLLATLFGYRLSRGKLNGIQSSLLIGVVGIIGIWGLGARLMQPFLYLARTILVLIPQIVPAIREKIAIDTGAVVEAWSVIVQASSVLASRWQNWFSSMDQVGGNDTLIRSMIWTLVMWLIAAWTGWFASRRNAILSLLPQIFLLAAVISYSENKIETFWLMVFILLLLMGLWNYKNHTIQWERRKVDYSDSIRYDNMQAVLFLAITIGILAFVMPSVSWRQIREFLNNRNRTNEAAEVLGIQPQKIPVKSAFSPKPSLPREHLLTEGFEQSQQLVMTIRTGELPRVPDPTLISRAPRYYWRSTIYDEYIGAGWLTTVAPPQNYKANTPLVQGLLEGYRPLHLEVELRQPQSQLFWSGILYSADIPLRVNWRVRPPSSLFADQTALLQADVFNVTSTATSYKVESFIPYITEEELRNASTEYPEDIRDHYLRLPQDVPERVHQLAKQIVNGIDNPYDKAKAIESYLRTNYPYDLNVPIPPENQDVADYFLFELRKGYCDYYATAMVVLARSNGLPARFVSGYASGSYDSLNAEYVVRQLNAHSWPEIYIPEIGWIEFEPTGSQPEIEWPKKESEVLRSNKPVTPFSKFLFQLTSQRVLYLLVPLTIAITLMILYFLIFERMLFLSLTPQTAIEILYRRVYRIGRPLAGEYNRSETAFEFMEKLIRTIQSIPSNANRWQQTQENIERLTSLYYSSLFSTYTTSKKDVRTAFHIWRQLRWSLFLMKINYWIWRKTKQSIHRYKNSNQKIFP